MRVDKNIIILGDPWGQTCLQSETYRRATCLIGETSTWFIWDPSETDMPHQRPTIYMETNMLGWRPTYLNRDRNTCLSYDTSETDMPNAHQRLTCLIIESLHYSNLKGIFVKHFLTSDFYFSHNVLAISFRFIKSSRFCKVSEDRLCKSIYLKYRCLIFHWIP